MNQPPPKKINKEAELTDTENILTVARREGGWGMSEKGKGLRRKIGCYGSVLGMERTAQGIQSIIFK